MKKLTSLILLILFMSFPLTAQSPTIPPEEHQRVKDLLIVYVSKLDYLEQQNTMLTTQARKMNAVIVELINAKDFNEIEMIVRKYELKKGK